MKKVNILLFIFLIIVVVSSTVYFSAFYGKDNFDYTNYKKVYNDVITCQKFDELNDNSEIQITAKKTKSKDGKSYLVSVVFEKPQFLMKDLNVLVVEKNPTTDLIYPSLGLIGEDKFELVPKQQNDNTQKDGIRVSLSLQNDVSELLIYFSYINNENRVERFYKVSVSEVSNNA